MGEISYEPLIRDMVWSYSRIKAFEACPYRWYLKYIRFPKKHGKDLFFADYGKFVHELIADFYSGRKSRQEVELEYLQRFREKVKSFAPNKKIFTNYFKDGLSYLRSLEPSANQVLAIEEETKFSVGDIPFIGYIDRVDRDKTGEISIIDNKSRKLKPRSGRKTPTKADEELDDYLRQLYLYSIPVKDMYGCFPSKLCFNCFRDKLTIEEPFRKEVFNSTLQWAADRVGEIAVETDFKPIVEYFKCRYLCEMQDYCEYYELSRR